MEKVGHHRGHLRTPHFKINRPTRIRQINENPVRNIFWSSNPNISLNSHFPSFTKQIPKQQAFLRSDVEEEHADLLADESIQSRGRARHPAEAGQLKHRTWKDFEELPLEYRIYFWSGNVWVIFNFVIWSWLFIFLSCLLSTLSLLYILPGSKLE